MFKNTTWTNSLQQHFHESITTKLLTYTDISFSFFSLLEHKNQGISTPGGLAITRPLRKKIIQEKNCQHILQSTISTSAFWGNASLVNHKVNLSKVKLPHHSPPVLLALTPHRKFKNKGDSKCLLTYCSCLRQLSFLHAIDGKGEVLKKAKEE